MCILSGVYIYRMYSAERVHRVRFHGFCGVPYDAGTMDNRAMALVNSKYRDESDSYMMEPSEDFMM